MDRALELHDTTTKKYNKYVIGVPEGEKNEARNNDHKLAKI